MTSSLQKEPGSLKDRLPAVDSSTGSLPILESYPDFHGVRLHSLTRPAEYRCARCGGTCSSALAATSDHHGAGALICPSCYGVFVESRVRG
ncbi:hypothetical protein P3102_27750 [Amycolatopsis sp. QT-25]|uniref:hypothetical protein n=1 Tax=Amycolatopsis sp. QT-25 TaxID=3034022 RepID=UPI0023ED6C1D|nr:hypothetical protein [Amycolatopsis sp. QT-25]WET77849.1 hypothetical protein P3102_27750 [Amycolatopsis sp. QT-25]